MRLLHTTIALIIVINSTSARCRRLRTNPVMGALHNIFSPVNAERTMQMLQSTQRTIGNTVNTVNSCNPLPQNPVQYPPPIILPEPNFPCNPMQISSVPNPVQPIQTPIQVQVPNPVYQMPVQLASPPVQMPSPPVQLPVQPNPIPIPSSVAQLPQPVPVQIAPIPIPEVKTDRQCPCERQIVYPSTDLPRYFFEYNPPITSELAPIALTSAQDIYTCPLPSPASLFTFPGASPCSSCARETTATKSQYLRKIPIPPPTL